MENKLIKELTELADYFKTRSRRGTSKASIEVWAEAAEEVEKLLRIHNEDYVERYECGCPVDEFGCQGYHGV